MVYPAPADKNSLERRRAFIKRTGAIMDCDPTDAQKFTRMYYSVDDAPITAGPEGYQVVSSR